MKMSYEKVSQAKHIIVGSKQVVKALKAGSIREVIIADDADVQVIDKMEQLNSLFLIQGEHHNVINDKQIGF